MTAAAKTAMAAGTSLRRRAVAVVAAARAALLLLDVDEAGAAHTLLQQLGEAQKVALDADDAAVGNALKKTRLSEPQAALALRVARRSRFVNLWKLMRDQLSEAQYLTIVRSQIQRAPVWLGIRAS